MASMTQFNFMAITSRIIIIMFAMLPPCAHALWEPETDERNFSIRAGAIVNGSRHCFGILNSLFGEVKWTILRFNAEFV